MRTHDDLPPRGLSRRGLLGGSSALAAALLGSRAAAEHGLFVGRRGARRPVFVQLFLRGAMDGLTTVVPHGDGDYYAARPNLAVPRPGVPGGALDLDGFFGLAPAAAPLLTPYRNGHLAIVHAAGSPDPTRSHFDSFARVELGYPNLAPGTVSDGWLTRALAASAGSAAGPLRAVGAGDLLPLTLQGAPATLPIADLAGFRFPGRAATADARVAALAASYAGERAPVGPSALGTFAAIELLAGVDLAAHVPANGAVYPPTELGTRLRHVAALIQADLGVEAITLDFGGWDLHAGLGPLDGQMAALLAELTGALEAFYLDLLGHLDRYVLVCLSEFGRRVAENASLGLDHGHGNALLVLGGGIHGGRVLADWPGLAPAALDSGDLAITSDYRDVLGELLVERLGIADLSAIFPGHAYAPLGLTT